MWYGNGYWRLLFPVRFFKCYHAITALLSRCHTILTPVRQFALNSYILILCVVLAAAGVIQIAETADDQHGSANLGEWTFFSCFFNSILVFATIGTPPADNTLARVFVGALAIVLVIIVPYQISKIFDISSSYSTYDLTRMSPSRRKSHIIICGSLTPLRIRHFFTEIFHKDHDMVGLHVVVMADEDPSSSLRQLLDDPFFAKRTTFMKGSILEPKDAERAAIYSAKAIFILTRKHGQESVEKSDHHTVMQSISAKRLSPTVPVYAQLHLASSRELLESVGVENTVCFSEVMHSMMAQNCLCPGFSTLIFNLTSSSDETSESAWEAEYLHGSSHEVYTVKLPPPEVVFGETFTSFASRVYLECNGVILFAIVATESAGRVLLNPGDGFICKGGETAFVIATDRVEADLVSKLKRHVASRINHRSTGGLTDTSDDETRDVSRGLINHDPLRRTRLASWQVDEERSRQVEGLLEQAIIRDVRERNLIDPIVIVSLSPTWPEHLEYFIAPLRAPGIPIHYPVVFVVPTNPTPEQWEAISCYTQVYIVTGDVFKRTTLCRGGVQKAKRVVILCGEGEFSDSGPSLDASTIAIHKLLCTLVGTAKAPAIVTELINRSSFDFISHALSPALSAAKKDSELSSFKVSKAFAAGLVYSTTLCDSLMINKFFNPMIGEILREFVLASWWRHQSATVVSPSRRKSVDMPQEMVVNTSYPRSSLYACEVPPEFIGKPFSFVFENLLASDAIMTLGIYRCRSAGLQRPRIRLAEDQRPVPYGYVYINPDPDQTLTGNDMLYILAPRQPRWSM